MKYDQVGFTTNTGIHVELERLFSLFDKKPHIVCEVEEDESVAGMVAAGFGIAVIPRMDILSSLPLSVISIDFPQWHRFIYMATLKKHYQNAASQALIDFVKSNNSI